MLQVASGEAAVLQAWMSTSSLSPGTISQERFSIHFGGDSLELCICVGFIRSGQDLQLVTHPLLAGDGLRPAQRRQSRHTAAATASRQTTCAEQFQTGGTLFGICCGIVFWPP